MMPWGFRTKEGAFHLTILPLGAPISRQGRIVRFPLLRLLLDFNPSISTFHLLDIVRLPYSNRLVVPLLIVADCLSIDTLRRLHMAAAHSARL